MEAKPEHLKQLEEAIGMSVNEITQKVNRVAAYLCAETINKAFFYFEGRTIPVDIMFNIVSAFVYAMFKKVGEESGMSLEELKQCFMGFVSNLDVQLSEAIPKTDVH
jgi:hypothetical protein